MVDAGGWRTKAEVEIPIVNRLTNKVESLFAVLLCLTPFLLSQLALILISTCGFGNPLSWEFGKSSREAMTFGDALAVVSSGVLARLLLPRWAYWLPINKYVTLKEMRP